MTADLAIARVLRLGRHQGDVVGRQQAYEAGMTRGALRAQIAARRWQRTGRQTFATHNGELSELGRWWVAVLEVGPTAALGGVTALLADGLEGYDESQLHVIAPKSARPRHPTGVVVHESRRFKETDVNTDGVRRIRSPVAGIHGALWAVSDRQAVLILVMTVQQKLATAAELTDALGDVRRHRRRQVLREHLADIGGGSESLNELDVLAGIRRRGLPEPSRQPTRRLSGGKVYLDIDWDDWKLVLEIDGGQHDAPEQRAADTLRDLEVTADGSTVLRVPSVVWRLEQEAVLDRLAAIFVSRGWSAVA
ncbi:MAG: hypothetical protein QOJ79_1071 [Actinomycetota bacterium]|jgi:hypothetical protein|nr:hypothetical protein [Actinomycetota bacterium]